MTLNFEDLKDKIAKMDSESRNLVEERNHFKN